MIYIIFDLSALKTDIIYMIYVFKPDSMTWPCYKNKNAAQKTVLKQCINVIRFVICFLTQFDAMTQPYFKNKKMNLMQKPFRNNYKHAVSLLIGKVEQFRNYKTLQKFGKDLKKL